MTKKKVQLDLPSPYKKMFGVADMGRGRPPQTGSHAGRELPYVEGVNHALKSKASARVSKVLKYKHWKEFVALYEQEVAYLIDEDKKRHEVIALKKLASSAAAKVAAGDVDTKVKG